VYGTLGIPAPDNIPGSREQAATWTDSSGNFWLFGGSDPFGSGGGNMLNDLWKFNPSTKEWTWVSGPSTISCTNYAAATALYGGYFCGQLSVNGTLACLPLETSRGAVHRLHNGSIATAICGSSGHGVGPRWRMINDIGVDPGGDFIGPINDLW